MTSSREPDERARDAAVAGSTVPREARPSWATVLLGVALAGLALVALSLFLAWWGIREVAEKSPGDRTSGGLNRAVPAEGEGTHVGPRGAPRGATPDPGRRLAA